MILHLTFLRKRCSKSHPVTENASHFNACRTETDDVHDSANVNPLTLVDGDVHFVQTQVSHVPLVAQHPVCRTSLATNTTRQHESSRTSGNEPKRDTARCVHC